MDKCCRKQEKTEISYSEGQVPSLSTSDSSNYGFFLPRFITEVSSIEWEFINMSEQEEDLIYRMYKLVGDRWSLIAGRIPGRKAEEIERFWIMRHSQVFASRRQSLT